MDDPTRFKLDNGMRIIVAEDHTVPVASAAFWTDVGVCDEPSDRRGIAHFLEHMMFRGSQHVDSEGHAKLIARMGGECNAYTSPDATVYFERVPAESIAEVFRLEADRFGQLRLTTNNLDIERKVILEELHAYENQPATRAMLSIQEQVMADHPYALSPLGRREDVEAITTDDMKRFCDTCYSPDRVVAVVCGDVNTSQIRDLAETYFGHWNASQYHKSACMPHAFKPRVGSLMLRLSIEVPIVAQVYRIGPIQDIDKPALNLLIALLSSGASSPLREALVRRRRLCVEAGCTCVSGVRGGLLIFFGAFLPPGRHKPRRDIIQPIIADLADNGPKPDQFVQHLKRFRMDRANDIYSHEDRALGLGRAEILEGGFERYHGELEDLSAVTPQRVQKLARDVFVPSNLLELDVSPQHTQWWMVPIGLLMRIWSR